MSQACCAEARRTRRPGVWCESRRCRERVAGLVLTWMAVMNIASAVKGRDVAEVVPVVRSQEAGDRGQEAGVRTREAAARR
jgi:hypothetical protein